MGLSFVRASGFRGIKESIDIPLPSGFIVISGPNGSGKSSICDAIEFGITGTLDKKVFTEKGEDISDYLWWRGTGRSLKHQVDIGIIDDNGQETVISRGPDKLCRPEENGIRRILCDLDLSPPEELTKLCRTSIIRDETITDLSVDLPEVDRFTFVKSAVGSRDFAPIEKRMKDAVSALNNQYLNVEKDYQEIRTRINGLMADLSSAKVDAARIGDIAAAERTLREAAGKATESISNVLAIGRKNIAEHREELARLVQIVKGLQEVENRRLNLETQEFKKKVLDFQRKVQGLHAKQQQLSKGLSVLEDQLGKARSGHEMAASIFELAQLGKSIGLQVGKCPLCGSRVSEADFLGHIEKMRACVENGEKELSNLIKNRNAMVVEENGLKIEVERTNRDLRELVGQAEFVETEFAGLENEMQKLKIGPVPGKNYIPLIEQEIEKRRDRVLTIEKAISTIESSMVFDRINKLESQLEDAKKESVIFEKQIGRLQLAESRGSRAVSEIKRILGEFVDERLAELSPLFNELYSRLRPHVDWPEINYHIRGDVRRFLSLRIGEDLNPRFMFSSGQRRAAGLAFLLAVHLSRSWCRLSSLILDDPIHHIDDYRALNLVELLAAIRRSGHQIICTTEDPSLAELLCRRLRSSEADEGCLINMEYRPGKGITVASIRQIYPFPTEVILSA